VPELWTDPDPPEPRYIVPDKVLIPACIAVVLFGAWFYGWLDTPLRFIYEEVNSMTASDAIQLAGFFGALCLFVWIGCRMTRR
jgi:hypothetical protein